MSTIIHRIGSFFLPIRAAIGWRSVPSGVYRGRAGSPKSIAGSGEKILHASAGQVDAGTTFFATAKSGALFVSEDEGLTWQSRTPALGQQSGEFGAVAAASGNGRIAYVGFRGLKLGERPEDLYSGIAKTVDAGKNWSIVFRESTQPASNLDASWIEQRADGTGGRLQEHHLRHPLQPRRSPGNPDICYATDLFRTYRTLDGGKTWAQVNSVRLPDNH